MATFDPKGDLHRYLQQARRAVVWKLEGASEYDVRRPLVPTGTNLLGLVKHLASVEAGYFGEVFGRPMEEPMLAALDVETDPDADLWVSADESRADVLGLYGRVGEQADATIGRLDLDAEGRVPWWPRGRDVVTLGTVLVHVTTETHRHAGHADILRELVDGSAGLREDGDNLGRTDPRAMAAHHDRLERLARTFDGGPGRE